MPRFVCPLVPSFFRLFFRSLALSFVHTFVHSFIRSFVLSFIISFFRSFVHSFIQSFIRSFVHSFIYLSVHSFVHSFMLSLICSFDPSLFRSLTWLEHTNFGLKVRRTTNWVVRAGLFWIFVWLIFMPGMVWVWTCKKQGMKIQRNRKLRYCLVNITRFYTGLYTVHQNKPSTSPGFLQNAFVRVYTLY